MQPPPDHETQPLILGRYRRWKTLGQGAYGEIVRAVIVQLDRVVAIEILRPSHPAFRACEARFERAVQAASHMGNHPHIVAVYELDRDALGTCYLITGRVHGEMLGDRLTRGPLLPTEALQITADVARGLHAAHLHGVVHRDVKPANIFLAAYGLAQIDDFGIAQMDGLPKAEGDDRGHPYTLLYASPEQLVVTSPLGPASDQYSLGLVLFEMLTGRRYRQGEAKEREALLDGQPAGVAALIRRMAATEPGERYGSLEEVATAIAALGADERALRGRGRTEKARIGQGRSPVRPVELPSSVSDSTV